MDILDKLNGYASGYRDEHEFTHETVFAEVSAAIIEELRAIRELLEAPDRRAAAAHAVDTRRRSLESSAS